MKFRSEITCHPGSVKIDHDSSIVLFGSCFSENMAQKFDDYKFKSLINPFGILFNPAAIENAVNRCSKEHYYTKEDLINHKGTWISLDHHSRFDQRDSVKALKEINKNIQLGQEALLSASHIIITLGSAWVYKWRENDKIVGNCHKIPQKYFNKELLSSEEINLSLHQTIAQIRKINKTASFIFTVSPVRHLKDGFVENTLSKSLLHKAIHELTASPSVSYFPSYEIMMDDLRDYRFYKKDLVHPNEMAVDYIWDLFKNSWISDNSKSIMTEIEEIERSLSHRPFDPESEAHKDFLHKLELKISNFEQKNPQIDFTKKGSD